eukprot:CAMPEP_0184333100 /NCGR_PEP_ID=MMETSP1089-20130417/2157_1 /TAXON_ID=38269 ORGANISM="Gloeochaete wittrockiana, Strain SAG46.84" /NCGR_SAMPLE_ID=MMETSP1089 /ASSEMBLY_ACC=CAM_ASM_000445 /LENGTH=684 /DNA_ID=CAMNT_0026656755 /DNA_START=66 /DNA_END=2120 /DNA_ORIENTATION=-
MPVHEDSHAAIKALEIPGITTAVPSHRGSPLPNLPIIVHPDANTRRTSSRNSEPHDHHEEHEQEPKEIVLYHDPENHQMVVLNETSRRVSVRKGRVSVLSSSLRRAACPLCGQAYVPAAKAGSASRDTRGQYMSSDYFALLGQHYFEDDAMSTSDDATSEVDSIIEDDVPVAIDVSRRPSLPPTPLAGAALPALPRPINVNSGGAASVGVDETGSPAFQQADGRSADGLSQDYINSGYYKRFFVEESKIGSGGYGAVYLARHVLHGISLGEYAVKKVPVGDNRAWLIKVLREVRALEQLAHPNVVQYKHSWLEWHKPAGDFGPEIPVLFILMEYANAGNLAQYIQSLPSKHLEENEIWAFFIDILLGLRHLHHSGIIHRDMKPQNLLLHTTYDAVFHTKTTHVLISDFGQCTLGDSARGTRSGNTGTVEFMAPEVLEQTEGGQYRLDFDCKTDVWSVGVILYLLCYSSLPFAGNDMDQLVSIIIDRKRPLILPSYPERSQALRELIVSALQRDAQVRPSVDDILQRPDVLMHIKRLRREELLPRHTRGAYRVSAVYTPTPASSFSSSHHHQNPRLHNPQPLSGGSNHINNNNTSNASAPRVSPTAAVASPNNVLSSNGHHGHHHIPDRDQGAPALTPQGYVDQLIRGSRALYDTISEASVEQAAEQVKDFLVTYRHLWENVKQQ